MKIRLKYMNLQALEAFLVSESNKSFSYPDVGLSKNQFPPNYQHDFNKIHLGKGETVFEKAKSLIKDWEMFPKNWTQVYPFDCPIVPGQIVSVSFYLLGFWWSNSCRIIYIVNNPTKFGFAYGTLDGHAEKGEEYFGLEIDRNEDVWYEIKAFSRPGSWLTKLAFPIARYYQKKFVRESMQEILGMLSKV